MDGSPRRSPHGPVRGRGRHGKREPAALRDWLTDLPSRALFRDRLERSLDRARRDGSLLAVLFLDPDRFGRINSSLGHSAGDRLLVKVSERISAIAGRGEEGGCFDTLARFGGDSFLISLDELPGPEVAEAMARRLVEAFHRPFHLEEGAVHLTVSVGIALGGDRAGRRFCLQVDDLLRRADVAMHRAKEAGGDGWHVFDRSSDEDATRCLERENDLRRAIEKGTVALDYQPIVSLPSGRIRAVEALARWRRPGGNQVLPSDFIPLAEETGLIHELGTSLLKRACRDMAGWMERTPGARGTRLNVNVSPYQLEDGGFVETVAETLEETGLEPGVLQLEVTEQSVMKNLDAIRRLAGMGVGIVVDDFGSGYSSLQYLKHLPVDCLKIDKSFVAALDRDPRDGAIVSAVVALGRALGLEVVGEGVERRGQWDRLVGLGCDLVQGYFSGRPASASEVERLLAEDSGSRIRVVA